VKRTRVAALPALLLALCSPAAAQLDSLPPPGDNQRSEVTQWMGPVAVTVQYSSPDVHAPDGSDRAGHIWGELVPWGIGPNPFYPGYGTAERIPWRAGSNENTTVRFSHDVTVEGQPLAAGTYGFHLVPGQEEWEVIFSRNSTSWGSFFYDPAEDALRVKVKAEPAEYREWLTYDFSDRKMDSTTMALHWERLRIPVKIAAPNVIDLYIAGIDREMRNRPGGMWQNWFGAANFLLNRNVRPEKALEYARAAAQGGRGQGNGQENFQTLSLLSRALEANGQTAEAATTLEKAIALPQATAVEIHQTARQLQIAGQKERALAIFQANYDRFAGEWPTHVGMARGLSAAGRYAEALEHARKALEQAKEREDAQNVASLTAMIPKLEAGQDVN
jgi:hypothetical protein